MTVRKIAYVASVYRHFEAFHLPYMRQLQAHGWDVHAYAKNGPGRAALEQQGVTCHDIAIERHPLRLGNRRALRELTESFRDECFDVVHVHTPVAAVLGRLAARRARVPKVLYTAHGFHFHRGAPWLNWLLFYPLERWLARYTDILITINREDAGRARSFPVRGQVVCLPGVGLDLERYRPADAEQRRRHIRLELGLHEREFVILCIAELNAQKNHLQLLHAVEQLHAAGRPVQCLLAGTGEMEDVLHAHIHDRGLQQVVHLLGHRSDIPDLLAASDVCTLLSHREGLPRAVLEAMAAGRPVVATDVRGSRDLVIDNWTGKLVPIGDVTRTVEAFDELVRDRAMRQTMGERAARLAVLYDITRLLQQMTLLYGMAVPPTNEWAVQRVGEGGTSE